MMIFIKLVKFTLHQIRQIHLAPSHSPNSSCHSSLDSSSNSSNSQKHISSFDAGTLQPASISPHLMCRSFWYPIQIEPSEEELRELPLSTINKDNSEQLSVPIDTFPNQAMSQARYPRWAKLRSACISTIS